MRERALAKSSHGAIDDDVANTEHCCRHCLRQIFQVANVNSSSSQLNFTQRRTSMTSQDDLRPRYPMNRRAFVNMVAAGAASTLFQGTAAAAQSAPKARNVVLVHGLFADGSSWSEVIARLQAAGLNATAVQNPLTTLPEAVASAERVLARQDGPTVLVGHSFSGMMGKEAGADHTAVHQTSPPPPPPAGVLFAAGERPPKRGSVWGRFPGRPAGSEGE